jgi:asparagine synthase (glutamine-hydrolysing)
MCGIAGFIDKQLAQSEAEDLIKQMLAVQHHRGPDFQAFWQKDSLTLGHNRLSIIDLSEASHQPFHYGEVTIVFNGEVYNYIELKKELSAAGYVFNTQGDTEVICAAYLHWGTSCVKHFIGMWAFALWDEKNQQLFCSRDRFGIKPFLYISMGEKFYFASALNTLKKANVFNSAVNVEQLKRGLVFGWADFRGETVFSIVKALEPGHNLLYRQGKIKVELYWDIDFSQPKSLLSWEEKREKFYSLFMDAVKLHFRSDVSNGICLSGGLDSTSIASAFSTLYPQTPLKTFTIYFEGEGRVDERPYVYETIKKYPNLQPFYQSPTHEEVAEIYSSAAWHADVPLYGSSHIAGFFVMRLAKQNGVTVVNDGQGSDEYLGGYLHSFYRLIGAHLKKLHFSKALALWQAVSKREGFSSGKKADFLAKSILTAWLSEQQIYELEYKKWQELCGSIPSLFMETFNVSALDNFLYHLLFHTTLQPILHFEDRKSMAYSIESRVPFLDHRLVEFAFTLRTEDRISSKAETKYILREGLKNILPTAVYERKDKKGFVTPGEIEWLNGPLKFLLEYNFKDLDFLNYPKAMQMIEQYKKGNLSNAAMVWKLVNTNYWLKNI